MKKALFYKALKNIKSKPELRKKIKIFALIGMASFLIISGLLIWAGVSAFQYVTASTRQVMNSPTAQQHLETAMSEIQGLHFQPVNCWVKAQSLLVVQPWLERPAIENLVNMKIACLGPTPTESSKPSEDPMI